MSAGAACCTPSSRLHNFDVDNHWKKLIPFEWAKTATTATTKMHLHCIAPPELYCWAGSPVTARNSLASINLLAGMSYGHEHDCIAVAAAVATTADDDSGRTNLRFLEHTIAGDWPTLFIHVITRQWTLLLLWVRIGGAPNEWNDIVSHFFRTVWTTGSAAHLVNVY